MKRKNKEETQETIEPIPGQITLDELKTANKEAAEAVEKFKNTPTTQESVEEYWRVMAPGRWDRFNEGKEII